MLRAREFSLSNQYDEASEQKIVRCAAANLLGVSIASRSAVTTERVERLPLQVSGYFLVIRLAILLGLAVAVGQKRTKAR